MSHTFHYDFTKPSDSRCFMHNIASDGAIRYDSETGLTITSDEYTLHTPPGINGYLDHVKWLGILNESHKINSEEFIYEANMSAQQLITPDIVPPIYRSRIRNIHEDYRLCSSGLVVYDEINMLAIMILFTDDWIYGYYECYSRNPMSQNATFVSVIPLCKRGALSPTCKDGSLDDFVTVGIGIDSSKGTIKFYVNKMEMFCIPRIGYRLADQYQVNEFGGIPFLATPHTLKFGFGHFSFLDHNIPNNYARQYLTQISDPNGYNVYKSASGLAQLLPTEIYREPYPDYAGDYRPIDANISFAYSGTNKDYFNFHQGMITQIKYITGYTASCNKISKDHVDSSENSGEDSMRKLLKYPYQSSEESYSVGDIYQKQTNNPPVSYSLSDLYKQSHAKRKN